MHYGNALNSAEGEVSAPLSGCRQSPGWRWPGVRVV